MNVKRGELYYADLSPVVGSEQGGIRPVLVVQNDVGNKYSPTIIAAAVTSKINKAKLPTHIELPSAYGLAKDSVILLEQIRTIDKRRLKERGDYHYESPSCGFSSGKAKIEQNQSNSAPAFLL